MLGNRKDAKLAKLNSLVRTEKIASHVNLNKKLIYKTRKRLLNLTLLSVNLTANNMILGMTEFDLGCVF